MKLFLFISSQRTRTERSESRSYRSRTGTQSDDYTETGEYTNTQQEGDYDNTRTTREEEYTSRSKEYTSSRSRSEYSETRSESTIRSNR